MIFDMFANYDLALAIRRVDWHRGGRVDLEARLRIASATTTVTLKLAARSLGGMKMTGRPS